MSSIFISKCLILPPVTLHPPPTHPESLCLLMWMVHRSTPPPPPLQCLHSESEQIPWGWCMLLCVCTLFSPLTFYAMKEATVHPVCPVHLVFRKEMHWGGHGVWQGGLGNTAGPYFTKCLGIFWKQQLTSGFSYANIKKKNELLSLHMTENPAVIQRNNDCDHLWCLSLSHQTFNTNHL